MRVLSYAVHAIIAVPPVLLAQHAPPVMVLPVGHKLQQALDSAHAKLATMIIWWTSSVLYVSIGAQRVARTVFVTRVMQLGLEMLQGCVSVRQATTTMESTRCVLRVTLPVIPVSTVQPASVAMQVTTGLWTSPNRHIVSVQPSTILRLAVQHASAATSPVPTVQATVSVTAQRVIQQPKDTSVSRLGQATVSAKMGTTKITWSSVRRVDTPAWLVFLHQPARAVMLPNIVKEQLRVPACQVTTKTTLQPVLRVHTTVRRVVQPQYVQTVTLPEPTQQHVPARQASTMMVQAKLAQPVV